MPYRKVFLWALVAATLRAQTDPGEILLKVRDNVLRTVRDLPRYLCTQTVERSQYDPMGAIEPADCGELARMRAKPLVTVLTTADRLRLDVGVTQGREAYSWVGENRFGDRSLFEIVKEGALSTGYFRGFLAAVFRSDNPEFSYVGEKVEGGRKVIEYEFDVPREKSHYFYHSDGREYLTAYEGSLTVDPETAELLTLTVKVANMPAETGACEATTTIGYRKWRVSDADFLLPTEVRLNVLHLSAVELRNRTVYTGCHEFKGESTLRFESPGEGPAGGEISSRVRRAPSIPSGLRFRVQLAQNIDVVTAAAGDPVSAVLNTDMVDGKKVIAARGAAVACRIQKIRRYYNVASAPGSRALTPVARVELLLGLETVATPAGVRPIVAHKDLKPGSPRRSIMLGPLSALGPNLWFASFDPAGDDYVIRAGLESDWVTAAAR